MTDPGDLADISALTSEHGRLAVHYDIGTWISCPPVFPEGFDRSKWALTFAEAFSKRPGLNPSEREIKNLAATLSRIHEYTYGNVACHMCFIHQPHPSLLPLPVYMATWRAMGDRDEALRRLTNVDDPEAIEPPSVEEFSTRELGQGLKVLRFGREPGKRWKEGKIFGALNYAWREEKLETDLRVFASTGDIGRLRQAIPDIDELVNVTKIVPAPPV
jgi:hypothetical protein